jgi:hypothetical protein
MNRFIESLYKDEMSLNLDNRDKKNQYYFFSIKRNANQYINSF